MDKEYWNNYYKKKIAPVHHSQFAADILENIERNKSMLELGCGNGRDAIFLGQKGLNIVAIDQAKSTIEDLQNRRHENIRFINDNFVDSEIFQKESFDYVYSRFTLHTISQTEEIDVIKNAYHTLKNGGVFFIEARGIHDSIYGLGEEVERNAYIYDEHYRRFIVLDEIILQLKTQGFEILFAKESKGWAIFGEQNPVVMRIYAKKS